MVKFLYVLRYPKNKADVPEKTIYHTAERDISLLKKFSLQ